MDVAGCHPDDLIYYPISSGRHNAIWTLSHPDELDTDRISSGWLMADALCHPDDSAGVGISSGWATVNSLCHPDGIPFHLMSSEWLNLGWYLIRMSNGNVVMSSGWDTLPFLSHQDEIANFDFPQHAVALQRFRIIRPVRIGLTSLYDVAYVVLVHNCSLINMWINNQYKCDLYIYLHTLYFLDVGNYLELRPSLLPNCYYLNCIVSRWVLIRRNKYDWQNVDTEL